MHYLCRFFLTLGIALAVGRVAWADGRGPLRVGAAKVDITPPADAALPMAGYAARTEGFKGIHDHIYVRAIVIDDGATQVALVAWELIGVPDQVWEAVSKRVAAETGISSEHLLLLAVHDHGAPALAGGFGPAASAGTAAFTAKVEDAAVDAVREAKSKLQPARMGIGTGKAYLNINRREPVPGRNEWALGYNENGPSDKTLTVVRFEDLSGKPIALLINYAVHCVIMGQENYQVTGDFAGATSRFVEMHYLGQAPIGDAGPRMKLRPNEKVDGDGMVALWTSGAAGDQNPVSMGGGQDFFLVDALGKMLGEQVVRVSSGIDTATTTANLWGIQRVVSCPGRRWNRNANPPQATDSDPVNIRLSLVMLNDIALAGVSGEVFTLIHQHLDQRSPFHYTIMLTHTNGSSGYIPDETAFDHMSYEIMSSRLKPGCAESAIITGLLEMMNRH